MTRFHQWLLIGSFVPFCWYAMMAVHELGHVAVGWATGGDITRVVLHPLAISRTDVSPNPRPRIVAWAGPVVGVALPLALFAVFYWRRAPRPYLLRWFAGFCAVANGAYIGIGSIDGIGDAGDLLRAGTPAWQLWAFGSLAFLGGLFLWHGLGPYFGFGPSHGQVDRTAAYVCLALLVISWSLGLLLSPRA